MVDVPDSVLKYKLMCLFVCLMKFVGIVLLVDLNIILGIMYLFTIAALEKIVFIYPPIPRSHNICHFPHNSYYATYLYNS